MIDIIVQVAALPLPGAEDEAASLPCSSADGGIGEGLEITQEYGFRGLAE